MQQRIINCPNCGKAVTLSALKKWPAVKCPECGNSKCFKDGFKQIHNGKIQRDLCRDRGYRFS